jgi:uncharacterized damage-inducible protein DinB
MMLEHEIRYRQAVSAWLRRAGRPQPTSDHARVVKVDRKGWEILAYDDETNEQAIERAS